MEEVNLGKRFLFEIMKSTKKYKKNQKILDKEKNIIILYVVLLRHKYNN